MCQHHCHHLYMLSFYLLKISIMNIGINSYPVVYHIGNYIVFNCVDAESTPLGVRSKCSFMFRKVWIS